MIFCTGIIINNSEEKVFAWSTNNPNYANKYVEAFICEIHFSNGLIFKFDHSSCLSIQLSKFLTQYKLKPFGSRFVNNTIVELRSFPCKGYKLLDYLELIDVKEFTDDSRPYYDYLAIKKKSDTLGVVPETLSLYTQMNSLCDIILIGELSSKDLSYMYNRQNDIINVTYAGLKNLDTRYLYSYKVLDLEKFNLLLTKIHVIYSKFFQ